MSRTTGSDEYWLGWDRVGPFLDSIDWSRTPTTTARAWVVVLTFLLTDYRYLYL